MASKDEQEVIDLELKQLELEKKEIEMQKRELELRRRKVGAAAQNKNGAPKQSKPEEVSTLETFFPSHEGPVGPKNPKKPTPGFKPKDYKWRNLLIVMLVPIALLGVTITLMRWKFDEPICPIPCEGICNISKQVLDASPPGCAPESPSRLLFNLIPGTSSEEVLLPMMQALKDIKEFEFVKMRAWRDVGTHAPVFLSPVSKSGMKGAAYDGLYMQMNFNLINVNASFSPCSSQRKLIAGKSYFHDLVPDENANITVRTDPIRHIAVLRDPIERFRDQLDEEWQKRMDASKFAGKMDIFDKLDLAGCLDVKPCRMARQLGRWCNLQTRMMCGWHRDCAFSNDPNATQLMLDIALKNLENNYSAVLIAEDWDLSVQLLEATHPTYFEGLTNQNSAVSPPYCQNVMGEKVCPKDVEKKKELQPAHRQILKNYCWADTALYQRAKELFYQKAHKCGLASGPGTASK